MSNKVVARLGRLAAAAAVSVALVGLGGGVASAEETPDGVIQEVGGAVSDVEEATGVADATDSISEATGVDDVEEDLGVTKAEEGLGLG
ncbi:hypothetical protein [Actinomycetospora termitidis]|uniref:ATP-binding protein n=1 Tax=Actinomycetospora termitidis TaxID=3053470 RepID=A0ABT7M9D9_9PSEU|nr:hypothetical protein [Actinomycetospora sp. Odt1-22]MDL5157299.1 hypothetical protein [Actinomycetospora sp. Odt1-22]